MRFRALAFVRLQAYRRLRVPGAGPHGASHPDQVGALLGQLQQRPPGGIVVHVEWVGIGRVHRESADLIEVDSRAIHRPALQGGHQSLTSGHHVRHAPLPISETVHEVQPRLPMCRNGEPSAARLPLPPILNGVRPSQTRCHFVSCNAVAQSCRCSFCSSPPSDARRALLPGRLRVLQAAEELQRLSFPVLRRGLSAAGSTGRRRYFPDTSGRPRSPAAPRRSPWPQSGPGRASCAPGGRGPT